jgi:hypothetical protein
LPHTLLCRHNVGSTTRNHRLEQMLLSKLDVLIP